MKKRLISTIIALFMLASCFCVMSLSAGATENDDIVIVIDPGHGGTDPGNTGAAAFGGDYESHHVYDISAYVKERLLQYMGVTVYLTREDLPDNADCPTLESRPNFAKEKNADAFVSIHTNAFTGTSRAYGAEIWVPDTSISFNNKIAVDSQAASSIVLSTMNAQTGVKARASNKTSISTTSTYPTGEKADKLAVINGGRKNNIPVVMLVETCFATDESDYNSFLATTEKRMQMGYAIADGLATYYNLVPRVPDDLVAVYGSKLSSVTLPGGWSWVDPNASVGDVGTSIFTAQFIAADSSIITENVTVRVEKASPDYSIPKDISAQYLSKLSDVALPDGWKWQRDDTMLNREGTFTFPAIFTPSDTDNYTSIKANISVTVTCTEHIYSSSCDTECLCGYVRTEITHTFDNDCDPNCNNCTFTRTPEPHKYDNACDTTCNICSAIREVEDHKYTDSCDATCDICGNTREVEHTFDNTCDTDCSVCGYTREITHTYSHVCDAICNVCSARREVNNHTYTNPCDSYCDVCSEARTPEPHKYDNACDTTCNVCNSDRETTHTYDNPCDSACNVCQATRTTSHAYDNDTCGASCNVCGATRGVTHAFDSEDDTECNVCGAVRASVNVEAKAPRGCRSSIYGIFAIISSIVIGFAFTRKRK